MSKAHFLSSCCETWAGSLVASSGLQLSPVQNAEPSMGPAGKKKKKKKLCQFLHSHTPPPELITPSWVPKVLTTKHSSQNCGLSGCLGGPAG